jgi:DNA repair exonuclease SbcCD nuclease subunit
MMDYVALGHWHGFSSVGKYKNVYYSGSTERTSSSDRRDNKGYIVVDFKSDIKLSFKTIDIRKSYLFKVDASKLDDELKSLELSQIKDSLVEVVLYNLTPSLSIDIADDKIKERFKDAMHIKIKREFVKREFDSISQSVEASSLEDYFISYIDESLDSEDKDSIINKAKELFALVEASDDSN